MPKSDKQAHLRFSSGRVVNSDNDMNTFAALWNSVTSTLGGLPSSEFASGPAGWMLATGFALLAAANVWMWARPLKPSFAAPGLDRPLRGGLVCSSTAMLLLVGGVVWGLFL